MPVKFSNINHGRSVRRFGGTPSPSPVNTRKARSGLRIGASLRDLHTWRGPQLPVCARHAVQKARLARRALRLTPEVNSGCLCPTFFFSRVPATARLPKTHCTDCITCTTGIAFNAGSEFRLLMPVGRAPDVARGPSALRESLPAGAPPQTAEPNSEQSHRAESFSPPPKNPEIPSVITTVLCSVPNSSHTRLCKTRCTGCKACTTGIAFNAGSEFRLLMPVGRAPDVARGPSTLREGLPAGAPPPDC